MANKLEIQIQANDLATKELNKVKGHISKIDKQTKKATRWLKGFNEKLKASSGIFRWMAAAGSVALWVIGAGMNKAINNAVDLWESINATNVIFEEAWEKIQQFGKIAAREVGLSNAEFNQMASETGALFRGTGLSMDETADKVIELTKRASDLASVHNTDVSLAMSAIQQALRGETEAIRKYAANVTDAELASYAMSKGIQKSVTEMTQQEKVLLRMDLLLEQTNKVQGDFANTSGELANRQRILEKTIVDTTAKLWLLLVPMKEAAFDVIEPLVNKIGNWIDANPELASTLSKAALTIAGVTVAIWTLWLVIWPLTAWFIALKWAVIAMWWALTFLANNPIWWAIAAIWSLIAIGVLLYKNWDIVKEKAVMLWEWIMNLYNNSVILKTIFWPLVAAGNYLINNWDSIKAAAVALIEKIGVASISIIEKFTYMKDTVIEVGRSMYEGFIGWIDRLKTQLIDKVSAALDFVKEKVRKAKDLLRSIWGKAVDAATSVVSAVTWSRANGGSVVWGNSYIVWERWPEIFTPSGSWSITSTNNISPSININMGNVNVTNEADENRLVDKITRSLTRTIKVERFWIS